MPESTFWNTEQKKETHPPHGGLTELKRQDCRLGERGVRLLKLVGKSTREEEATQGTLYGVPFD